MGASEQLTPEEIKNEDQNALEPAPKRIRKLDVVPRIKPSEGTRTITEQVYPLGTRLPPDAVALLNRVRAGRETLLPHVSRVVYGTPAAVKIERECFQRIEAWLRASQLEIADLRELLEVPRGPRSLIEGRALLKLFHDGASITDRRACIGKETILRLERVSPDGRAPLHPVRGLRMFDALERLTRIANGEPTKLEHLVAYARECGLPGLDLVKRRLW